MNHFQKTNKVNILGININNVTMEEALEEIENLIKCGSSAYIVTPNVDHIIRIHEDRELKKTYDKAEIILADGMPLVIASKLLGVPLKERVTGVDLFPELCRLAKNKVYKIFLLGDKQEVIEKTTRNVLLNFPMINIVGIHHGYFNNDDTVVKTINTVKPDILFIGMGSPKQELWIYNNIDKLNIKIAVCVGGAFSIMAGVIKRAPRWMQRAGLEWFWRLIHEPRRLWKRYLIRDMKFFYLILREKIKLIKSKQKTQC